MAVFFRVLLCVIAAFVYYAVFFRVRLLLHAYYDGLVPDPGSRSRLQHAHTLIALYDGCVALSMNTLLCGCTHSLITRA